MNCVLANQRCVVDLVKWSKFGPELQQPQHQPHNTAQQHCDTS